MRHGDVVELLATQHLAPPLPDVPQGTLGEVTSTPPALWIFMFPGYYAGFVLLDELRVVHGPRAWAYRARRYYRDNVRGRLRDGSSALTVAVVGPVVAVVIGGVPGAVIGGAGSLVAGGAVNLAWRLITRPRQSLPARTRRRPFRRPA